MRGLRYQEGTVVGRGGEGSGISVREDEGATEEQPMRSKEVEGQSSFEGVGMCRVLRKV